MSRWMSDSVGPDQTPQNAASDLSVHFLRRHPLFILSTFVYSDDFTRHHMLSKNLNMFISLPVDVSKLVG